MPCRSFIRSFSAEHFAPAFEEAFVQARAAVDAIAGGADVPTFANTIEAIILEETDDPDASVAPAAAIGGAHKT